MPRLTYGKSANTLTYGVQMFLNNRGKVTVNVFVCDDQTQ